MKKMFVLFIFMVLGFSLVSGESEAIESEKAIVFEAKIGSKVGAFEGTIMVPENRTVENGKKIPIKYVRFPSTSDNPGAPIVYLSGGPGGSGINTAKYRRFPLFMALREFADVIALDQRGTGASDTTPECHSSHKIKADQIVTDQQYIVLHQKALKECLNYWQEKDVDVMAYTTEQSVADLEALRGHLGAEKISLWGISYGSHLALAALKVMDDRIEKVMIASAEGLSQTVKMPHRTDDYFDRLQAAIDTQSESREMFGDIKKLMNRVHHKLENQPMKLSIPQSDGTTVNYLLQRKDLQMLASGMIADPSSVKWLLQIYAALDNDVVMPLTFVLQRYIEPDSPISYRAMPIAMDLASGMSDKRRESIKKQAQSAVLRDYLNFSYHLTDVLPEIDLGDVFRKKPHSTVPTLLLSGTLDGRTYIESQHEATQGLTNLTSIKINNAGHNLFMTSPQTVQPDVLKVIRQFMRNEKITTTEITIDLPKFSQF